MTDRLTVDPGDLDDDVVLRIAADLLYPTGDPRRPTFTGLHTEAVYLGMVRSALRALADDLTTTKEHTR